MAPLNQIRSIWRFKANIYFFSGSHPGFFFLRSCVLELAQGSQAETLLYSHCVFGLGGVLGPVLGTGAEVFSGDRNLSDV